MARACSSACCFRCCEHEAFVDDCRARSRHARSADHLRARKSARSCPSSVQRSDRPARFSDRPLVRKRELAGLPRRFRRLVACRTPLHLFARSRLRFAVLLVRRMRILLLVNTVLLSHSPLRSLVWVQTWNRRPAQPIVVAFGCSSADGGALRLHCARFLDVRADGRGVPRRASFHAHAGVDRIRKPACVVKIGFAKVPGAGIEPTRPLRDPGF